MSIKFIICYKIPCLLKQYIFKINIYIKGTPKDLVLFSKWHRKENISSKYGKSYILL